MAVHKTTHDRSRGDDIVVFMLGFRINKPWRPDAWLPVLISQKKMVAELQADPTSGLLASRTVLSRDGAMSIQYWKDTESLYAYAADAARIHRPAWIQFFRQEKRTPGAVGIWHETYTLAASETIYGDMPPVGLGAALGQVSITEATTRAKQRLGLRELSAPAAGAE